MKDLRPYLPVVIFSALYMLAAIVAASIKGNKEFIFYIAVMLILIGAVFYVHLRVGLTMGLLWMLSIWGLMHMAGGLAPVPESWPHAGESNVLYNLWFIPGYFKYDHLTHAFGFGTTTWLCWQCLSSILTSAGKAPFPSFGMLVLVGAAAMGFGALNEVVEFIAVLLVPETNVGGYINTGWDLVSNLMGVTVACVVIRVGHREN